MFKNCKKKINISVKKIFVLTDNASSKPISGGDNSLAVA